MLIQFQKIPGVLAAWTLGRPQRQIDVVADRDRLAACGLPILDPRRALDAANFDRGGSPFLERDQRLDVRALIEFREKTLLERLPELPVGSFVGRGVHLEDVAVVKDGVTEFQGDFLYNGEPAIWLRIQAEPLRDYREVANRAEALVELLEQEYPGLGFDVVLDKTFYMDLNDGNALQEFLLAVALAGFVMLRFLGEIGGTLIAAETLPFTIAFGFFAIHMLGLQKDFWHRARPRVRGRQAA